MINRVPRRLGKYEIGELLGRGGMAEVWQAFDTQLRRAVAIKVMRPDLAADPEFVTRFTREAQVIAALRHPNIVQIYDFQVSDSQVEGAGDAGDDGETVTSATTMAYMVMEYIQGQTLAQYLRAGGREREPATPAAIIRLFTPICLALDYAHQQGVIHRDIKPANILLDQRNTTRNPMGEPILSDFGLAKMLEGEAATITGTTIGTPLYMSPEQIQDKPLSDRSDLYSLGAVLYEVCAGAPPFEGDSVAAIMMRHITERPTPPDDLNKQLPAAVSHALMKSLAKDPQDRYPSASALLVALAEGFGTPVPEELRTMATLRERDAQVATGTPVDAEATIASQGSIVARMTTLPGAESATVKATSYAAPAAQATARETAHERPGAQLSAQAPTRLSRVATALRDASGGGDSATLAERWLRGPRLVIAIALVCALVASGLGAAVIVAHRGGATTPVAAAPVGQALFVSSGQVNAATTTGINDELQISLKGIPAPQPGKSYYAWLLPNVNQTEAPDVALGKLTVQQGTINFLYPGDSRHTDLLAITSRFLITEESSSVTPDVPTPDLSAWRYYAALPQTPAPGQQYSLLDHLRHLLAKDPDLEALNLHGGLDIWAFRDTQQIFQWALSARDDWNAQNYDSVRTRAIQILDYLDGSANVARDTPAGTPILADKHIAKVGMLEFDPQQNPPGYLYHIELHLNGVLQAPGSTQTQRTEATHITAALGAVKIALTQARHDATQLAHMSDAQLAQSSTLSQLNDLVNATTDAYQGQISPTASQTQEGMSQIYPEIQKLAAFNVTPYHK